MGMIDTLKKWKRLIENYLMYRRSYLFLIIVLVLLLYLYPSFHEVYVKKQPSDTDNAESCLDDHITPYYLESLEGNANIRKLHTWEDLDAEDDSYLPWVGNGHIGLAILPRSSVYIKHPDAKTLSLPIGWSPLIVPLAHGTKQEAVATHFPSGIVSRYQCYGSGLYLSHLIYSHRSRKEVLIQEMKIANPTSAPLVLSLDIQVRSLEKLLHGAEHRILILKEGKNENSLYNMMSGAVHVNKAEQEVGVAILMKNVPSSVKVESHRTTGLYVLTIICTDIMKKGEFYNRKAALENKCIEVLKNTTSLSSSRLKQEHIDAWYKLWSTGLYISKSKAAGALNGDKINATIYYVLSNTLLNTLSERNNGTIATRPYTAFAEGCYGGYHHTLQAVNLWKSLKAIEEINDIVSLWLLTLEKQGCHKLIKTGAMGVGQAMVLSFGGFRFSGQHLEFKIDPKFLHRDYIFRRIHYDDMTAINVSVTLQDDNKAQLGVSLDKSDRPYYACDGGCSEEPVQLGSEMTYFPVKLTEPITSILYITPDKDHMELIKDTLHVHKIVEAPAYDHHVIALHRHGHHLGGLPTLFWASICFLIIIFHLFLFKLIFNEYCDKQDKHRNRYGKM
uniref:Putative conserved plasma membrane protein n=1 Tax=Panstrongylus megistus TaxID=65343 RepID=A0A069DW18_9HEMI